jgi:hypothetical protein
MNYRQIIFFIAFLLSYISANAQNIDVKSFKILQNDQTARVTHPVKDQNGEKCALIKVVTSQQGFVWEGGILGVTKVKKKTGEYWVYIPHGSKKITIKHEELGILRDYPYPVAIKEATTYEMVLTTGNVKTIVEEPEISTVWLMITTEPEGADAYIEEKYAGQTPLQRKMKPGKYNYRISKDLFAPKAGVVTLTEDEERKKLEITLNPNHGSLYVNSSPEQGAKVYINEKETNKVTPCTIEKIAVGSHTVTLRKKWYKPKSEKFTIEAGQEITKDVEMEPSFGKVSIRTNPSAHIFQDGEKIGSGKIDKRLMPGVYKFKAQKDKYHSDEQTIEIQKNDDKQILLTLQPKYGTLEIKTEPWEASIEVNGKEYGTTPKTIRELLVGKYELKIEKEGYKTINKTIEIKENEETVFNKKLISGKDITISSKPKKGKVKIDGEEYGTTPLTTRISYGEHEIEVEKGEYITKDKFQVSQDEKNRYHFPLALKKHFYLTYTGSIFPKNTEYIAPVGLKVGITGNVGWYISGRMNPSIFKNATYEYNGTQVLDYDADQYYSLNGNMVYPVLSITGGISLYTWKKFHLYFGGGYGLKQVYRNIEEFSYSNDQKIGETYVEDKNFTTRGILLESGVMFQTNNFIIDTGLSTLKFKYLSVNIGVGISF